MIKTNFIKEINGSEEWEIIGNDIPELLNYSLNRIRNKSKDYYKESIKKDLELNGSSLIDHHAGMGIYYKVKYSTLL